MRHTLGKEVAQSVAPTVTHLCVLDAQTTDNIWHRVVVVDIFSPAIYLLYLNKLHVPTGPSCNLTSGFFSALFGLSGRINLSEKNSTSFVRFFFTKFLISNVLPRNTFQHSSLANVIDHFLFLFETRFFSRK